MQVLITGGVGFIRSHLADALLKLRHCYADITHARNTLGYAPRITLDDGLRELAQWLPQVAIDNVDEAAQELAASGLTL